MIFFERYRDLITKEAVYLSLLKASFPFEYACVAFEVLASGFWLLCTGTLDTDPRKRLSGVLQKWNETSQSDEELFKNEKGRLSQLRIC